MCIQIRFLCEKDYKEFLDQYIAEVEIKRMEQKITDKFALENNMLELAVKQHLGFENTENIEMFFVLSERQAARGDWQTTHMRRGIPFTNIQLLVITSMKIALVGVNDERLHFSGKLKEAFRREESIRPLQRMQTKTEKKNS